MARNLSHNLKRVVAGLCAVLVVAGAVPAQPIADIFSETAITVSAENITINQDNGDSVVGPYLLGNSYTIIFANNSGGYCYKNVGENSYTNPSGSATTGMTVTIASNGDLKIDGTTYTLGSGYNAWGVGVESDFGHTYWFYRKNVKSNQSWTISAASAAYTGNSVAGYTLSGTKYGDLSLEYTGRNNTTYNSTTAPTDVGDYHVVVTYSGNDSYNSRSQEVDFSITKATNPLTYTGTQSVTKTYSTSAQTATLTAATKGQGTVTYSITSGNNSGYFSLSGTTLTIKANTPAGTYYPVITATAAGNSNYNSGSKTSTVTVTVNKANISPSVTMNGWTYGSTASNPSVSGNPGNGTPTYQYKVSTAANNTYSDTKPTNAGTYTVKATIPATTNYNGGTATANFTISPKTVSNPTIELDPSSYTFDGNEKKPAVVVKDGSTTIPATEYTVSYSNNKNAGTATVTITDKANGNYTVSGSKNFTINKAASSASAPSAKDLTYNTNPQALVNAGTASGGTLMYKVTTENNEPATSADGWSTDLPKGTNAGQYYVWYYVKGDSNHNDSAVQKVDVTIKQAENGIAAPTERTGLTYTSKAQALVTKGSADHGTLYYAVGDSAPEANSNEWSTSIPKGTEADTYKVWTKAVDPNGNYKTVISEEAVEVTIAKKDITGAQVILSATNVPDTNTVPTVTLVVVDGSIVVPADDYTTDRVVGADNIGTLTVTANSGSTNFTGSATAEYVVGTDIRDADVDMIETYEYTGDHIHPHVEVTYEGVPLNEGEDYTVLYDDDNNVSIGTSAVKIKGKGNYAGTITKTLSITAKNVSECTPEIADHVIYTGEALTPELTMKNGGVIMEQGSADGDRKDYITYYSSNTDVGTATIIVVGSGNYKDSCKVTFNIKGQLGTDGTASQFTTANVNKKISLDENGHISAESFGSGDIDVAFAGKTLTKDTDYTVTVKTYDSASKTGVITLTGKGSYEGSVYVPFTTKNKYQTLTVADAIHENVKVGTFENSSEYSQLIPGEKYTIENNTGYVLTLKSDSDSVADVTIGKDKTVTFEVEDDVNYSLAIHTHRLIATNIDGALYVTCEDGDSTNTLLANIDTFASYTYGTLITPVVVVNEDEQNRTSNIQLKVYDSDDEEVSVSALATSDVGTYTVRASLMYNGATYNLEKSFEITPKEITLTPDPDQSKTYGNADPTQFTYTTDGLIAKDIDSVAFNQYIKRQQGDIVREYNYVLVKGETPYYTGGLTVGNYKISLAGNSPKFTINKRNVTVTLENNVKTYGEVTATDTAETLDLRYTAENMIGEDTLGNAADIFTIGGMTNNAVGFVDNGNYSVIAVNYNNNYNVTAVTNDLVINKKVLTADMISLTGEPDSGFIYDTTEKTVGYDVSDSGKIQRSDIVCDSSSQLSGTDAGTYTVKFTAAAEGNYVLPDAEPITKTWTIAKRDISSEANANLSVQRLIYNGTEQHPTVIMTYLNAENDTVALSKTITTASITYVTESNTPFTVDGEVFGDNYTGTRTLDWIISKAENPARFTNTEISKIYDGEKFDDTVEVPEDNGVTYYYARGFYDESRDAEATWETTAPVDSYIYTVKADIAESNNFKAVTIYKTYTINRRPITVTPDAGQKKTYGVADSGFTCTTDDPVANSEGQNFSEYIGRNAGENVGPYDYTITDEDGFVGNYAISIDPANTNTFEIVQKDIEGLFTPDPTEFIYDGTEKTLTVTGNYGDATAEITKTLGTDDYDISDNVQTNVNRTGKAEVGTYTATVTGKGNYTGEVTFTYKINPKDITSDNTVTLALDHTSYTYQTGVTNTPELTVTDTARNAVLTGADYTSDLAGQEYVGNYTVTVEGQGNYTGTKTVGWTIEKAYVDISVDEKTGGITYDAAAVDDSDFVVTENNSDTNVYTLTYYADNNGTKGEKLDAAPANAGKYWVEASMEATDNFNAVTSTAVQFTIKKATAAITPTAGQSQVYGAKTENLAFTVDGLQGNDTQEAVFAVDPLMVVDSNNTKLANDHILQADGSYFLTVDPDVVYDNYVTVLDGTAPAYTVTKRSIADVSDEDIKITSEAAFVYDGNSHAVEYQTKDHVYNYGGTLVEKDLAADTDYQVTGSSGIIAKEYSLQFKGNGNYNNVKQLPWSITAKAIAAKIVAVTNDLTYNGQNVGGNFSVKTTNGDDLPAGAVVTLTYTGRDGTVYEESTTAPTNAGKYTVTATATLKNYTITFADSYNFEIKQKAVTVTPDPGQTKVYGTETPEITYSLNGVIEGEDVDFTSGIVSVNCDKWADVTDTGYAYSIVDTDQGNYTLALDTAAGTFKVTPKNINEITFELDSAKVPLINDEADASAHIIAQYGEKTLEKDTDYTLDGDISSFVAKDGLEMTVMGIGNYTGSKDIAWSAVEKQAAVYSNSLTLNGEIIFKINVGFNSYEDLSGKTITAKLTSSVDDTRSSTYNLDPVAGERLSSNNFGYDQAYRFQIPLAPAEIGDTIFIEVFADGESIFKTNTSVLDYCRRMLRNPSNTEEFKSLLAALIDYATAAQDYFGYNSDNKADQIFTENDFSSYVDYGMKYVENGQDFETVINNTIVDKAAINSTLSELLDGSDIKLEYTSSMFNHSSGQFMRHFFTVENATVADAVAKFSDRFGIASDEISVRVYGDEANNRIVVETSVIPQAYLRDYDKLSITLDGQTVFGYTCIDYAAVMNEKYSIEKLKKLNEKFYYFSIAAYKYYIG